MRVECTRTRGLHFILMGGVTLSNHWHKMAWAEFTRQTLHSDFGRHTEVQRG